MYLQTLSMRGMLLKHKHTRNKYNAQVDLTQRDTDQNKKKLISMIASKWWAQAMNTSKFQVKKLRQTFHICDWSHVQPYQI